MNASADGEVAPVEDLQLTFVRVEKKAKYSPDNEDVDEVVGSLEDNTSTVAIPGQILRIMVLHPSRNRCVKNILHRLILLHGRRVAYLRLL